MKIKTRGVATRNLKQYKELHALRGDSYGRTSRHYGSFLSGLLTSRPITHLLDYGCGNSNVASDVATALEAEAFFFDPAVPGRKILPQEFLDSPWAGRFLLCIHVLEHVDEEELPELLEQLKLLAPHFYIEVPLKAAKISLPSGENAHSIVRPALWWHNQLREVFGDHIQQVAAPTSNAVAFMSWDPKEKPQRSSRRRRPSRPQSRSKPINEGKFFPPPSLHNKTVAVVGRARSLLGSGEGERIDSCDVVIRVNIILPLCKNCYADTGSRTDLVYTCGGCKQARIAAQNNEIPSQAYDKSFRRLHSSKDGYTPFTGTVAILWALTQGAKSVYATGMDLYSGPPLGRGGGNLQLARSNSHSFHDPNRDREMLLKLWKSRPQDFIPGSRLRECLESPIPLEHFKGLKPPTEGSASESGFSQDKTPSESSLAEAESVTSQEEKEMSKKKEEKKKVFISGVARGNSHDGLKEEAVTNG